MSNNITLTKRGNSVTIRTIQVKDNYILQLSGWNDAALSNDTTKAANRNIISLNFVNRNIEVTGYIASDTGINIVTLRDTLKNMILYQGTTSFTYMGETVSGYIQGLEIREVPHDKLTPKFLLVTFNLLYGVDAFNS